MEFYQLVLGVLVVWRITHLLNAEDGPWDLLVKLRKAVGNGFWGRLLDCFFCLSLWIAAPFALLIGVTWIERGLLWPSLSAGAILMERVISRESPVSPAPYVEDKEDTDALLRQEKN